MITGLNRKMYLRERKGSLAFLKSNYFEGAKTCIAIGCTFNRRNEIREPGILKLTYNLSDGTVRKSEEGAAVWRI